MRRRMTGVMTMAAMLGFAGYAAAAASAPPMTYQKTALSEQEIFIFQDANVNPDCTVAGVDVVRTASGPSHGTLRIVDGKFFPNFPKTSERYKCNSQSSDGVRAFYKSAPDFKGQDQVSLIVHTFTGNVRNVVVNITVE